METIVIDILAFFIFLFAIAASACTLFVLYYLVWTRWRQCKHCGHTLKFRGLQPDENNGHYLFHCPCCGAWEQVPKEELFIQCGNPVNKDNKKHGKTNNS